MKRLFHAAAVLLALAAPAGASPHGFWPDEARGHTIPRPAWVLVVPAMRLDDGSIKVWSRADDWPQQWVVPKPTPSGLRTVAISGDSEDRKLISPGELDNMRMDSLRLMATKYGADALAVAVLDGEGAVAVAAWARGSSATWEEASAAGSPRAAALTLIDGIFSGEAGGEVSQASEVPEYEGRVRILAQRPAGDGATTEYRLKIPDDEAAGLATIGSLTVTRTGGGTTDVIVNDGRDIADVLTEAGLVLEGDESSR